MSRLLSIAFMSVPLVMIALAYAWAFHLRDRPRQVRRALPILLGAGAAALFAGDAINGFSAANGFHAGFFVLGILVVAAGIGGSLLLHRDDRTRIRLAAALDTIQIGRAHV